MFVLLLVLIVSFCCNIKSFYFAYLDLHYLYSAFFESTTQILEKLA